MLQCLVGAIENMHLDIKSKNTSTSTKHQDGMLFVCEGEKVSEAKETLTNESRFRKTAHCSLGDTEATINLILDLVLWSEP